jgi:radical SAM superfamily enzyme YgiQ (UPF0313 family)
MEHLAGELGVSYFYFCDDNFVGYGPAARTRLMHLSSRLQQLDLGIRFRSEIRADSCRDVELLEALQAAGLTDVLIGVESGSATMLRRISKGMSIEINARALEATSNMGFQIEPSMILVDGYTSVREFAETVQFIEDMRVYECRYPLHLFNRLLVFPGAPVEKRMAADGMIELPNPWDVPEDLNDDDELLEFCRRLSNRPYTIVDPVVRVAWQELARISNQVSELAAFGIPSLLQRERVVGRRGERGDQARMRSLGLLAKVREWRRGLGELTRRLMRTTADWCAETDASGSFTGSAVPDGGDLGEALAALADEHDRRHFDGSPSERPLQSASGSGSSIF